MLDREDWLAASSLQDLAEQTARWLEGASTYLPTYGAPGPDPETAPLAFALAAMNRLGLMTDTSQPGVPLVDGSGQRAGLMGWCSEVVADRVAAGALGTDLVVMVGAPGAVGAQVVVTIGDGAEFTWFGAGEDPDGIAGLWGEDLSPKALAALLDAWTVTVIDPVWGRNTLLWPTVLAAPAKSAA